MHFELLPKQVDCEFKDKLGSISAVLSCPIYVPPRKETAGRVSGKPCL